MHVIVNGMELTRTEWKHTLIVGWKLKKEKSKSGKNDEGYMYLYFVMFTFEGLSIHWPWWLRNLEKLFTSVFYLGYNNFMIWFVFRLTTFYSNSPVADDLRHRDAYVMPLLCPKNPWYNSQIGM